MVEMNRNLQTLEFLLSVKKKTTTDANTASSYQILIFTLVEPVELYNNARLKYSTIRTALMWYAKYTRY